MSFHNYKHNLYSAGDEGSMGFLSPPQSPPLPSLDSHRISPFHSLISALSASLLLWYIDSLLFWIWFVRFWLVSCNPIELRESRCDRSTTFEPLLNCTDFAARSLFVVTAIGDVSANYKSPVSFPTISYLCFQGYGLTIKHLACEEMKPVGALDEADILYRNSYSAMDCTIHVLWEAQIFIPKSPIQRSPMTPQPRRSKICDKQLRRSGNWKRIEDLICQILFSRSGPWMFSVCSYDDARLRQTSALCRPGCFP